MGNKCQCLRGEDGQFQPCFKKSKRENKKPDEKVLPGDLHSGGGQKIASRGSNELQRPDSLGVQATHNNSSANQSNTTKFPQFSLHGVQKTSPASGNNTPLQLAKLSSTMDTYDVSKVEGLFNFYCDDPDEQEILADGIERFCHDLEVDPTEFSVLALVWKFKAETMCKFTRKEFFEGFFSMRVSSMHDLKLMLPEIEKEALSNFKDLYRYTFQYALDSTQGQRSLPCDIAIEMWNIVFCRNVPAIYPLWVDFLHENNVRGISRDTWNMFLYLSESLNEDMSNYNDNEAWPSLFDDFVDYRKEKISEEEERRKKVELEKTTEEPTTSMNNDQSETSTTDLEQGTQGQSPRKVEKKLNIPGSISSSSETSLQVQGELPSPSLTRVPSSPGEILNHLHSE